MIKKLFVTFITVLYLGVSSGATLHYQYCMGHLIKVSLWHDHTKKCDTCGMERKEKAAKECCTHQHQLLKSDKSSLPSYTHISLGTSTGLPIGEPFRFVGSTIVTVTAKPFIKQAPPPQIAVPLFLRNCAFLI
ncbi:HYC_CC_PP family protein [Mucilaginibacter aquariorum]|uniref:Secreted protein n=1 Tax=Mucilaginibacter aquariorum TaxID=2967225 RepID=A0ABT1T5P6_9SPHI|nr:hypothetical protein [Mucilaginibacter aquariorum]MCQ6959258.1 hypothetical protein [Mucilaginibacter aquariorum]